MLLPNSEHTPVKKKIKEAKSRGCERVLQGLGLWYVVCFKGSKTFGKFASLQNKEHVTALGQDRIW